MFLLRMLNDKRKLIDFEVYRSETNVKKPNIKEEKNIKQDMQILTKVDDKTKDII